MCPSDFRWNDIKVCYQCLFFLNVFTDIFTWFDENPIFTLCVFFTKTSFGARPFTECKFNAHPKESNFRNYRFLAIDIYKATSLLLNPFMPRFSQKLVHFQSRGIRYCLYMKQCRRSTQNQILVFTVYQGLYSSTPLHTCTFRSFILSVCHYKTKSLLINCALDTAFWNQIT